MSENFPLPYVNERPEDAMRRALSLIKIAQEVLEKPVMSITDLGDIDVVLNSAAELLRPIQIYLDQDERCETLGLYQAARRAEVMTYGGNE